MFQQRRKFLLMVANTTLRKRVECSKELCKKCPDLSGIAKCESEECELKRLKAKLCNDCCDF